MSSTITFNQRQITAINSYFGQAVIPTSETKAQVYLGASGDEVIELYYELTEGDGSFMSREMRSNQISSPESRCVANAQGEKIEPACGDITGPVTTFSDLDQSEVLVFMAAISGGTEVSPEHRGSLDASKVATLRRQLGL